MGRQAHPTPESEIVPQLINDHRAGNKRITQHTRQPPLRIARGQHETRTTRTLAQLEADVEVAEARAPQYLIYVTLLRSLGL